MSHFSVAVLTKGEDKNTVSNLLAPYQENNMGDCPSEFLEFVDCTEEVKDRFEEDDKYTSMKECAEKYFGYKFYRESNKYGYYENVNAKWDWYQIGGRWSNSLITKDGNVVDSAKLKDIDWDKMISVSKADAEANWIKAQNADEATQSFIYGISKGESKDDYIQSHSGFETYAVITPDGKWHSEGEMGWFGVSSETADESKKWRDSFYDNFIKNSDEDITLTIVDCHI